MDVSVTQALAAGDQDSIYAWGYLCGATNPSATSPMYLSERLSTDERPCDEPRLIVRGGLATYSFDDVRRCVPDQYLIERGETFRTIWPCTLAGDLRGKVLSVGIIEQ